MLFTSEKSYCPGILSGSEVRSFTIITFPRTILPITLNLWPWFFDPFVEGNTVGPAFYSNQPEPANGDFVGSLTKIHEEHIAHTSLTAPTANSVTLVRHSLPEQIHANYP